MVWRRLFPWLSPQREEAPRRGGWLAGLLGNAGERAAARFLRRQGFRILARSHRTPLGEIDLIATDGPTIVFVEVKTRRSDETGLPFEAVDQRKQRQLTKLALAFLKAKGWLERPARFDVVSIVWPGRGVAPEITHYRNAFEAVGRGQFFS